MYIHLFSTAQKFSTIHSSPARKEAQGNLVVLLSSFLSSSLVYTILLFHYRDITSPKPNKTNKNLYELMGESSWFYSTILSEYEGLIES